MVVERAVGRGVGGETLDGGWEGACDGSQGAAAEVVRSGRDEGEVELRRGGSAALALERVRETAHEPDELDEDAPGVVLNGREGSGRSERDGEGGTRGAC